MGLLSDHHIILVVRVIGVPKLAVRTELKLEELVPELAFMAGAAASGGHIQHATMGEGAVLAH